MPLYTFKCNSCEEEKRKIVSSTVKKSVCPCGGELERQLPTDLNSQTLEMRDKHRGVQLPKGHENNMRKRFIEHEKKYDRAEKIDRQGIETADRLGWTKKEK